MTIRSKRSVLDGFLLSAAVLGWVLYLHATRLRADAVCAEETYPRSPTIRPGLRARLQLLAGLALPNTWIISQMIEELADLAELAVPVLAESLRTAPPGHPSSYLACCALESLGPPAADAVTAIVANPDNNTSNRLQAATVLRNMGLQAVSAAPGILQILRVPDGCVRFAAIQALACIDRRLALEHGLPLIREQLQRDDCPESRYWAVQALLAIGPANEEARALIEQQREQGPHLQTFANWARTRAARLEYR